MNKISGYTEFTLASGRHVEFKICNATYEIYAKLRKFNTYQEVSKSLQQATEEIEGEDGQIVQVPIVTFDYTESLRLFMFAAAKYAAQAQDKPVDFNQWDVGEWLEEIGTDAILGSIDQPPAKESAKKKDRKPMIRPTQ